MSNEKRTKKPMTSKEFFGQMQKTFQAETGIAIANLNALYNAQLEDLMINFANIRAELESTKNKATSLAEENKNLKEKITLLKNPGTLTPIPIPQPKSQE